jgi:DNA-binding NtrC family response regulator
VSGKRVLVVDDDPAIRETIERNLLRWGYDVGVADSAEAALSKVRAFDPGLVITDVRMSGMTGLDLLAKMRESAPDIDVIVMTAYEDMRTAITAMKAGAFEYFVKPLDLDQIELVTQRCFRDRAARRRAARQAELDRDSAEQYTLSQLVGRNTRMIELYKRVGAVADSRAPVLVRGETGTGKELVARAIHFNSPASAEPFVPVNCTAVPESLLESELFGHIRGSFTGATSDRKGRFELAGAGTVFLDEIGDTTPAFQTKLLRVLQEREFLPVGAERPKRSDARVVAATHRNLEELVGRGAFRQDLYYRLRVVEIQVPALRERRDDIPLLADYILRRSAAEMHASPKALASEALQRLLEHNWPGNVRELENTLTRAALLARGSTISSDDLFLADVPAHLPDQGSRDAASDWSLRSVEREHVLRVLEHTHGNKRKAARLMGVSRSRLDRLLEKHGIAARPSSAPNGTES